MKISIVLAGLLLLGTLSGWANELKGPPATEFANEAADLPFNPCHLGLYTVIFTVSLALVLFVLVEAGQRIGRRHLAPEISEARKGLAAVDGFVFSLLGLLVAFTFHGAAERFDERRKLVIQEAESISTAWRRFDLLDENDRLPLRELFRQYLNVRLSTYRKLPDAASVKADLAHSLTLEDEIWQRSVAACHEPPTVRTQPIPALNHMFDMAHTRVELARIHSPKAVFGILIALTLISALLVGHGMAGRKSRSWTHLTASRSQWLPRFI